MPTTFASHPDYGYDRDFKGYGEKGLVGLKWPNNAKIAVSFVINYEEVNQLHRNDPIIISSLLILVSLGR